MKSSGKISHVLLLFRHVSGNFSGVSFTLFCNGQNLCAIPVYQFYEFGLSDAVQDRTEDLLHVRQT